MQESNGHLLSNLALLPCISGSPAILICINPQCQQSAPICQQNSCTCQLKHTHCAKNLLSDIISKMQNKLREKSEIIQEKIKIIQQLFDLLIQKLSKAKNKFVTSMELFGLQESSIKLITLVQEQKITQIDGQICSKVIKQLERQVFYYDDIHSQQITQIENSCKNHIRQILASLTKYATCFPLNIQSNIINQAQQKIIKSFIPKKVKAFDLIFRASRDGFQAAKFHEKCDGKKNTLILVQTLENKIVGGFTTSKWVSQQHWVPSFDHNCQSFLFSLNSNMKYQLKHNQPAIQSNEKYGPVFGNEDLMIVSDCDKEPSCCNSFGECFKVDKKEQFKQTIMKFIGSQSTEFYVKDYQVFRIAI